MAETDSIARMATKVGDDIFGVFGWTRREAANQNWKCVVGAHGKTTHPSDIVFWYDDPYRLERIFFNVDLKSYAAASVTKASISGALSSLALSVECANVSSEWSQLYGDDESNWRCDGLLFVYNHDNEYDVDFHKMFSSIDLSHVKLPEKRRIAVLGPPDVAYLASVTNDILAQRGKGRLPTDPRATEFWYPDLVRPKRREQAKSGATIEMLTGPWITLHIRPDMHAGKREFVIYYRDKGDSVDEFRYLIDSFFRFQMLSVDREAEIGVRLVNPDPSAVSNFAKAKEQVSNSLYGLAQARLERVRCESISTVIRRFSEVEIGMEDR